MHEDSSEIVRAIVGLAHSMRLNVIAEGVDLQDQVTQLNAFGCEYAQGYLFSEPLDGEAVEKLLAADRDRVATALHNDTVVAELV